MADLIMFGDGDGRLAKAATRWAELVLARADIPGSVGLPGSVFVMVELARDAASLADAARSEGDGRLYLAAANRLQTIMAQAERLASRDDDRSGADDWSDELARLLGSAPTMGDAEDG
jgi:hypothetical protein